MIFERDRTVAVHRSSVASYPEQPPFDPRQHYPEGLFTRCGDEPNPAYGAVRACLQMAGLDAQRYGSAACNPLGELIRPGETVLLKPNFVKESHPRDPEGWRYVLTHGSVIRAVADYVWKALEGRGRVIIADAPQTDSSFEAVVHLLGLDILRDFYRAQGLNLDLYDM